MNFLCLSLLLNQGCQGISVGRPRSFCPTTDLHERLQSLAGFHASGALPDEAGPCAVQGPGFHSEEKIQGHREALNAREDTNYWREQVCMCVCEFLCFLCEKCDKNEHAELELLGFCRQEEILHMHSK